MNAFADLHCHALCGVDDGAPDEATMYEMLRMAYQNGTRALCLTPHCSAEHMPPQALVDAAFAKALHYCRENLPDMELYLGNELTYRFGCVELLTAGECRTIADSRYVLVDFWLVPDVASILRGVDNLQNAGYLPIVAHVERYDCFGGRMKELARLIETGAVIQVNAESLLGGPFSRAGRTARRLLAEGWVDVVASDGHDTLMRAPTLEAAYGTVRKKYGEEYATRLFSETPGRILRGEKIDQNR